MARLCEICKCDISGRHNRAKYCETCSDNVKREQVKIHYRKNKYVVPICQKCGDELVGANRNTKYCPPCRGKVRNKNAKERLDARVCKTEGCTESLEGYHQNTRYCATCAIQREKDGKKIGNKRTISPEPKEKRKKQVATQTVTRHDY